MKRRLIWGLIAVLAGMLGVLVWFSFHLAQIRIYQVDECTELYIARMFATGQMATGAGFVTLFQLILSCLVYGNYGSSEYYALARFVMTEIFWLNIVLMVMGAGEKLFSLRGLIAVLTAATLAPLWDYGFEIRHDNLLLTGILLMWALLRLRPLGIQSYFLLGALTVGLQFIAFKAFVYTIPLAMAGLIFPPPGQKISCAKSAVALVTGGIVVFVALRLTFYKLGLWHLYLNGSQALSDVSMSSYHFGPGLALKRLLWQTPLLLALTISGLVALNFNAGKNWRNIFNWNSLLPEALLFLITLTALLINPVPYPYDLLHLVPFAFIFAFRYTIKLLQEIKLSPALTATAVGILIFTHFMPFAIATLRHLDWQNGRQNALMALAEDITTPVEDKIYDGVGMTITRPTNPNWLLHTFTFVNQSEIPLRKLLTKEPAAVIIPNYRTDWLSEDDHAFIRSRYVPFADDFWVLGETLPAGGGEFQIYKKGHYWISTLEGSDIKGTYPAGVAGLFTNWDDGKITAMLDGESLTNQRVELNVGAHHLQCPSNCQPAIVWIGPERSRIPRMGDREHQRLFVNWY